MPITIGTEDVGHFQIGTERVGIMKIGTEIAYRLPTDTGQTTPWDFASSFTEGYAIDFLPANPLSANRLFEVTPPRGTLYRRHPLAMFTPQGSDIYWIERVHRFSQVEILFHKGAGLSGGGQDSFIPALSDAYTWYAFNLVDDGSAVAIGRPWKAWQANVGIRGIGGGYVRYDTAESGYVHRGGSMETFGSFLTSIRARRVLVALLPDSAWEPYG